MKISYNWLNEYIPQDDSTKKFTQNPEKLADILTSVGLEVESIEKYEDVPNDLKGLIVGEVLTCQKHPDADKLQVTTVDIGDGNNVQIICGASNVASGQKVVVATVGTTLYPKKGDPFTIKKAKIRGLESNGMLCAEDEIGIGESHDGIIVLPGELKTGTNVKEFFQPYSDSVFEIGLTPNRIDAMSHLGVAKDVCAWLSHHTKKQVKVLAPYKNGFKTDNKSYPVQVEIASADLCSRYSGITISGVVVQQSPSWLQNKLKSIGLRPVNNIVDITNFILHETGQPLHAFDADKINKKKIIVETLAEGTLFTTLDEKERKLSSGDIMICNGDEEPMCIAGVFGGLDSGVSASTKNIFLESAWFNPALIRKSLLRHNLRTDAAMRFEKGVDISNTVQVLKRAVLLIKEIAGGLISSDIVDVYPRPAEKKHISLSNHYLKKISGKNYHPDTVKNILNSLNFEILHEGIDEIQVAVPFSNPDINMPADVIEEIMRIDGLDNIEIPTAIKIAPAIDPGLKNALKKEKITSWLIGNGFCEIFTNSITNSKYFDPAVLSGSVKIINSLSEELDVMRPSMLQTGLESISFNMNRKNNNLKFFEFGKTYSTEAGNYMQQENLALYFSGDENNSNWNTPAKKIDIFYVKGICRSIFSLMGFNDFRFENSNSNELDECLSVHLNQKIIARGGKVSKATLQVFSIKQPVYFVNIHWKNLLSINAKHQISFQPIPKFPAVQRDLSMLLDKSVTFQQVEDVVQNLHLSKLTGLKLFDIFEDEKLGKNKRSFAINFTFLDAEKTLTDKEVDNIMMQIIAALEKELNAEIRRNA